jgi:rubrerythrin
MTVVVGIVIIAVAAAFVAMPFLQGEASGPDLGEAQSPGERERLERQKFEAYAAMKEAEFDFNMGKLSDTDLAAMRDKYRAQALEAIAALEAAGAREPRRVAEARRPKRVAFCPACGHATPQRVNFCPACGRSLKEVA